MQECEADCALCRTFDTATWRLAARARSNECGQTTVALGSNMWYRLCDLLELPQDRLQSATPVLSVLHITITTEPTQTLPTADRPM